MLPPPLHLHEKPPFPTPHKTHIYRPPKNVSNAPYTMHNKTQTLFSYRNFTAPPFFPHKECNLFPMPFFVDFRVSSISTHTSVRFRSRLGSMATPLTFSPTYKPRPLASISRYGCFQQGHSFPYPPRPTNATVPSQTDNLCAADPPAPSRPPAPTYHTQPTNQRHHSRSTFEFLSCSPRVHYIDLPSFYFFICAQTAKTQPANSGFLI